MEVNPQIRSEFPQEGFSEGLPSEKSYGEILNEIGVSARDLIQTDVALMLSELKSAKAKVSSQARNFAVFGFVLFLSVPPMMAFFVIGLGELLDGQYWLSALIVSVVFAVVGALGLSAAYHKIKEVDLSFSKTKAAIRRESRAVSEGLNKVGKAVKGDLHASPTGI